MESNHPAHTRCARPVLKTGGATGPLPSPCIGSRESDSKRTEVWEAAGRGTSAPDTPRVGHHLAWGTIYRYTPQIHAAYCALTPPGGLLYLFRCRAGTDPAHLRPPIQ